MTPIEQACYWMTAERRTPEPSLEGDMSSDFAIVGGGFTGLWTALAFREADPAAGVVLIEKNTVGYGGSGRNAGILGETIDHSHQLAIAHFGLEEARRLAELGRKNVDEMAAFFAANGVDCDFERSGRLYVALTEAHIEEAQRSIEVAQQLGVTGLKLLDAQQMQDEIHSPLYLGGMFAPGGGILHPVKLIEGLKRVAVERGVRIFENTHVSRIRGSELTLQKGRVDAKKVILATDAYTHHLFPGLLRRFIPLYDYILVSEPLTPEQHASIGWRNRQGVTDGRTFFNYYRLTADNRVLWGTSEAVYYAPNRVEAGCDHSERHYEELRRSFQRHFPQIGELKFPYAWGGPIASTTRFTPFFGTLEGGRVVYALGYTGQGVGTTRIAGKILAHLALEKPHELLDLSMVRRKPFPYPPEPLRAAAVHAVTGALRRVDAGQRPSLFLRLLDWLGLGFSS
ncbi:MAG TPA: FAD-dependent oxidoreductase [Acidobacteriota bacterium]|nr:FAD-dependent oxidoreductase [Acidobacteriota bacterium]